MYYLIFGLLYLVSLLPVWVLHRFSDAAFFIMYHILGYRKEVVMHNLSIAFPEKTEEERKKISRKFFRNLTDTFIETIKLMSITEKELKRRYTADVTAITDVYNKGKNVNVLLGHRFNWEYTNLALGCFKEFSFIGIYMPISNKIFNRIFLYIRTRTNTRAISVKEFADHGHNIIKTRYAMGLAADQNPGKVEKGMWLNFFNKPAPFIRGPVYSALKYDVALVYADVEIVKRGFYRLTARLITEEPRKYKPEDLVACYRTLLENNIKEQPDNYLWSHRRWRHEWKPGYPPVIDEAQLQKVQEG